MIWKKKYLRLMLEVGLLPSLGDINEHLLLSSTKASIRAWENFSKLVTGRTFLIRISRGEDPSILIIEVAVL